jgi:hypothetical protein
MLPAEQFKLLHPFLEQAEQTVLGKAPVVQAEEEVMILGE